MSSAPGDPPGSRVNTTPLPFARKASARSRACELLPVPSPPSKVMKRPLTSAAEGHIDEAVPGFEPHGGDGSNILRRFDREFGDRAALEVELDDAGFLTGLHRR